MRVSEAELEEQTREDALKEAIGVEIGRGLPKTSFTGDGSKKRAKSEWRKRSVKHLTAVLRERGEGTDGVDVIAAALDRLGYLDALVDAPTFSRVRQGLAEDVSRTLQGHWSARHAVHVWDRQELSRNQMESLRHLLSFLYDPVSLRVSQKYARIRVWQDPHDERR